MFSKYLKWAIVIGLFAIVLITPFYVSSTMFFPFITGKNFFFRIIVEIIFALWLVLAMADSRYRPKKSPVLYALAATVLILTLSTIFGDNPYRSFWSNYERMEGLIGHLHLFAYFLVLSSIFISQKEWRRFLYLVSVSGAAMAIYGYLQVLGFAAISTQSGSRADGTFGNASYMAIFMMFAAFIAAHLYFSEDKRWLKNIFAALVIFEIPIIFLTGTRGAILGLIGGVILFVLLLTFLSKDRRVKIASLCAVGGVILFVAAFLLVQNKDFIIKNPVFARFSNLSFRDRTVQSRFTIWRMSFEGFKERPVFGWGLENYNQVFNKYYQPSLWPQEQWFDRSHNIIFDWLIHGGAIGLLAYLGIFITAIYALWRGYNADKNIKNLITAAIFTSLFAAYIFHNFFVFDNLISYLMFFSILAFIHFIYYGGSNGQNKAWLKKPVWFKNADFASVYSFFSAILAFLLIFSIYFLNIKPILANTSLLEMLKDAGVQGQNIDLILSDFNKSVSLGTFGSGEAREQLSAYANAVTKSNLAQPLKDKVNNLSISELEKQVKESPDDARGHIFLSAMYTNAGRRQEALTAVENALKLSPRKQPILFLLADSYLVLGDIQKAYETVKTAYDLDPSYPQAVKNFATLAIMNGGVNEAEEALIKHFGTVLVADQQFINAYVRIGRYDRARDIWFEIIKREPNNSQYHVNLAATFLKLGERKKSVQELEKAIELNPQFKENGEFLINEIKAGRNPVQ
ncbi:MAG: O-antigen ligase family protein [Patescibacteria group bacterium]